MTLIHKFFLLLSFVALFSCADEAFVEGTASRGLTAQIPPYEFEGNTTRVNISENLSTYTWKDGDRIGIYYTSGTSYAAAKFMLKQGGNSHGEFYNEAFSLKPNITYYAFYPYAYNATVDAYPVDFTGQVQTANGSTAHIGSRNYMSAEVNTNANGAPNIVFQNQAAVIQLQLPIEKTDTYTGVTLSTTDADFITKGTLNMKTDSIISTSKSKQMKVSFGSGVTLNECEILTVNVLVAPVNLSGRMFSVTLDADSKTYNFDNLEGLNIQRGKAYKVDCKSRMIVEIPYLTFTAEAEQTLRMSKAVETLEYSVNGGEWKALGIRPVFFGGTNGNLQLRGKNNKGTANNDDPDYSTILFGNAVEVACSGDIRTLVDYENYKTVSTENARFCHLFRGCTNLTTVPDLPATTLATSCYSGMFSGCTSLITAPKLPATTLATSCYYGMFQKCTSLAVAPDLPATTLAESCYNGMFFGCTSLTTASNLPATTLADGCYRGMFEGCTSLAAAPVLPATILAESCYESMFLGCTSLTTAPVLPATILAESCYAYMFWGCTSLTTAPDLPATTLAQSCYQSMFKGCISLSTAPDLPAITLVNLCYAWMFQNCSNLTYIKMMGKNISAYYCLCDWTDGVSSIGTFVKNKDATWNVMGCNGIPDCWTIQYEDENGNGNGIGTINPGDNHEG